MPEAAHLVFRSPTEPLTDYELVAPHLWKNEQVVDVVIQHEEIAVGCYL